MRMEYLPERLVRQLMYIVERMGLRLLECHRRRGHQQLCEVFMQYHRCRMLACPSYLISILHSTDLLLSNLQRH